MSVSKHKPNNLEELIAVIQEEMGHDDPSTVWRLNMNLMM